MAAETEYLAQPSGTCCLKGVAHDGEPRGKIIRVAEVDTYVSSPSEAAANGNIVLYFPDIFSLSKSGRLVMDSFACSGYLVLGIDYFQGDTIANHMTSAGSFIPDFDFEAWKTKNMDFAVKAVPKWISQVKASYGKPDTRYACVGYCFGAPFVLDELAGDLVSAGAFAHPAFLKEEHFQKIKKPLLLSCAENDVAFDTAARRKAVDILHEAGKPYMLQVFSGVEHGFALRGEITAPHDRYAKDQSLAGMLSWFDCWLSEKK